jgi:2-C-methyl-D-erythritol 4-phosphate cytidylyltransferase
MLVNVGPILIAVLAGFVLREGFPRALLVDALRVARAERLDATDDAALCARLGHAGRVVRGSERALKVTDAADFARVEALFGVSE